MILRTSVILHRKENVGARNLPRCPVSQPGIGLLDLLSVDDALAKNPVLVADTVSVERQRQRRCRLEAKRPSLNNLSDVLTSHLVSGSRSLGLRDSLPQPQKPLAAFVSGDCCLGIPKMKLLALERSSNVPHTTNIAQFTQIPPGYLCDTLINCMYRS